MTRALVTGSTGGLGANLVAALNRRGVEVVGLRRKTSLDDAVKGLDLTFMTGDVLDVDSLRRAAEGVDWVFHLAAIADDWNFPAELVYRVNVDGAKNMMQAALEAGVKRFVLTSSAGALVPPSPGMTLDDETKTFGMNPRQWAYGHSKHLAEQTMQDYVFRGLDAVAVLPSAVMGPGDLKFISGELIVRAVKREVFPLPEGGLNFIDMRDAAEGHIAAVEKGRPGERYILSGHNMTHTEALQIISQVLGIPVRRIKLPRWGLPPAAGLVMGLRRMRVKLPIEHARVLLSGSYLYYDNSKAVRELGLTIRPFEDTVRDTYRWYYEHGYFARRGIPTSRLPVV
nr:NAD-dependent epimerase/dehydratase family protein [Anaerolineae bacterium]